MFTYRGLITILNSDEVFVFGSNLQGFHGAGAAGFATFGVPGNQWRKLGYNEKPVGWKGNWNVKGIGEGLQKGNFGVSYALPTVKIPGKPLSKSRIKENILKLYRCAKDNPMLKFLVAYSSEGKNLNGYTCIEIADMFNQPPIPENIYFEEGFAKFMEKKENPFIICGFI